MSEAAFDASTWSSRRIPEVLGVTVAVCAFEDLREMKRAAGRTQDLADLENLDAIEGE